MDMECIHSQLGGHDIIRKEQLESMWENWYGQIMRTYTDKNFRKLWQNYVIFGFVSKEYITGLFRRAESQGMTGLFIVGFFDVSPLLHIAYLDIDNQVHYYYLQPHEQKQPFRDFLAGKAHLKNILTLNPSSDARHATISIKPKTQIIEMLLPKRMRKVRGSELVTYSTISSELQEGLL